MKNDLPNNDLFISNEFRDFISTSPPPVVSRGMLYLLFIVLVLLSTTFFIKYSDTIPVKAEASSQNYPKAIIPRTQGRIIKLLKYDGDYVKKGDPIAYLESNSDYTEVLAIESILGKYKNNQSLLIDTLRKLNYEDLGDIQPKFENLKAIVNDNNSILNAKEKIEITQAEVSAIGKINENTIEDTKTYEQELTIAKDEYNKLKTLYKNGVISNAELLIAENIYLSKTHPINNSESKIHENIRQKLSYKKDVLNLKIGINEYNMSLKNSLLELKNVINFWHKTYVIVSPSTGHLRYKSPIQENDYVTQNDSYFYLESENDVKNILITIPQAKFGKVKLGQIVNIKIDSYPFEEYGIIKAEIYFISKIPLKNKENENQGYIAQLKILPNKKHNKNKIELTNGMIGSGEIICKKERLIVYLLKSVIKSTNQHP